MGSRFYGSTLIIAILLIAALQHLQAQPTTVDDGRGDRYRNPIIFARAHLDEETGEPIQWGKIWIMEENGSGLRQLTLGASYDDHPALFSDGRHALYSEFRETRFDPNGGARLIHIDIYSGEREVYAEVPDCALHHVTIAPPDDQLSYHQDCGDRGSQRVGWGPDSYEINMRAANGVALGDSVIFMHEKNPFLPPREVALVRLYGRGQGSKAVFLTGDRHLNRRPAVSSDGQWLAWQTNAAGQDDEVFLARIDGSEPRNLTNTPGLDGHPWFARDGKWIVFESDRTGVQEIWKINLETLEQVQLTFGGKKYSSRTPRW